MTDEANAESDETTPEADQTDPDTDQGDQETEETAVETDLAFEGIAEFLQRPEETIEKIASKADEDDLGPTLSKLDDLEDVVDEAEDLLSTMDLSELVDAIDWGSLPDAVDASELPDAIGEGDVGDAIDLGELLSAVDLSALFDNVDERELWREKREFDEEVEDVTGDRAGGGTGGFDMDVDMDAGGGSMGNDVDPRAIQAAVQREISGAVGEFRETLIEAHHRLETLREENQARFDERRTSTKSRNPTAGFSTMPSRDLGSGGAARYSTVPEETKYSSAPNRERIYGSRFDSAGGGGDG